MVWSYVVSDLQDCLPHAGPGQGDIRFYRQKYDFRHFFGGTDHVGSLSQIDFPLVQRVDGHLDAARVVRAAIASGSPPGRRNFPWHAAGESDLADI